MQLVAEPGPQDVVEADQATKVTSVSSLSSLSPCLSLPTSTATQGPVESCWTTSASRARAALCANSFQRLASLLAGPWSRLLRLIGHRVSSATLPVSKVTNSSKPSGTRLTDAFPIFCVSRSMSTCFARTNPSLPFQSHEQLHLQFCGSKRNSSSCPLFKRRTPPQKQALALDILCHSCKTARLSGTSNSQHPIAGQGQPGSPLFDTRKTKQQWHGGSGSTEAPQDLSHMIRVPGLAGSSHTMSPPARTRYALRFDLSYHGLRGL